MPASYTRGNCVERGEGRRETPFILWWPYLYLCPTAVPPPVRGLVSSVSQAGALKFSTFSSMCPRSGGKLPLLWSNVNVVAPSGGTVTGVCSLEVTISSPLGGRSWS